MAFLVQIRDLDQIGQDVVGVKAHQRIAVEQQARHRPHHHHVERYAVDQPVAGVGPDQRADRGDEQFGQHAGRAHMGALPFAAQRPSRGRVDVGQRREDQEHHAHRRHMGAIALADESVGQFVQYFDQGQTEVEPAQVRHRQHALRVLGQRIAMLDHGRATGQQHHPPKRPGPRPGHPQQQRLEPV